MPENAFEMHSVSFGYERGTRVLKDINLAVPAGKVTALIGPNGCGKTTAFALLSRIYRPSSGKILFFGRDISSIPRREYAQSVAAVHQYNTVPDDMTVRDLVAMGRTAYHNVFFSHSTQADLDAAERAMEETRTSAFAERRVKELSGGQMQRVWLALAMAQTDRALLLDEITTYLDVHYQLEMLGLIRSLNERHGTTVLMVLHDVNQTLRYADHVIMMKEGGVLAAGAPDEVITDDMLRETYGVQAQIARVSDRKICIFG